MDIKFVTTDGEGSKRYPCPDCAGRGSPKEYAIKQSLASSGFPDVSYQQRFNNFKVRPGAETSFDLAQILTASEPKLEDSTVTTILISGVAGNGKTHLAHASGLDSVSKGMEVEFVRCKWLMRKFKAAKSISDGGQNTYDQLFDKYAKVFYLIIDELDWDKNSEADISMIDQLVCERYETYCARTLMTTNRNKIDLDAALPRIMDRMSDRRYARAVSNKATSYRRKERR